MRKVLTRAMSLLLSAFMVFSCLVFAAPQTATKAEAATAGQYTFKVSLQYMKGTSSDWSAGVLEVFGGDNNGTGSFDATKSGTADVTKKNLYINNSSNTWYEQVAETTINYFPTTIKYYYSKSTTTNGYFKVRVKLSIKHSDGTWEEIPLTITRGNCGGNSWAYNAGSCASGDEQGYECNSSKYGEFYATVQSDYMPKPSTVSWNSSFGNVKVPKINSSDNTYTSSGSATVYDQYGVEWYEEPNYAISSSNKAVTSSESVTGITVNSDKSDSATLTISNSAKKWVAVMGETRTLYVNAYSGTAISSVVSVPVENCDVDVTFYSEGQKVGTGSAIYGQNVAAYTPAPTKSSDANYHYTFKEWDNLVNITDDSHNTVNAVYTATAHTNKVIETIEPTCITTGSKTEECTVCGYKTITTLPVNDNHSWGEWVNTYTDCTSNGTATRTCSRCNETETKSIDPQGHDYVAHDAKAATCAEVGWNAYNTCSRCDYTDKVEIPMVAHTEAEAVKENEVASTCTVNGSYDSVVYCSVCGTEISRKTIELPLAAHTEAEAVKESEVASTCTKNGSYDSVVYCSVCNTEISRNKVELPLAAHTEAEAVKESEVASTCTKNGSYESVVYCSVCGIEISRETIELPLVAHTEAEAVKENEVASTCTKNGSYESVVYCSVCGTEISRDKVELPLAAHTPGAEATCTTAQTCTVCGKELAPAKGHTMTKTEFVPATCQHTGVMEYYTCCVCNKIFADEAGEKAITLDDTVIEIADHDLVNHDAQAPTCDEIGWDAYVTCKNCDYTTYSEKAALGHDYSEFVSETPATCTEEGTTIYKCVRCDEMEMNTTSALGHDISVLVSDTPATCEDKGVKVYKCVRCEKSKTEYTDALGHDYSEFVSETPATCTEEGTTIYKCVRCDETEMNTTSALGHDISVLVSDTPATCEDKGVKVYKCVRCEEKKTEFTNALGHNFGEWKVVTEATETTAGLKRRECTRCDAYEEETIPVSTGKRVIKFVNIDKMHYVLDNDGEEYYVYNSGSVYWDKNRPLNFTVYTYSNFAYSDVIVKVNGVEISPDANGVYTVPAGDSLAVVTVTGAVDNGDGTKLSFWEWLVRLFKKIFSAFGSLFGGNSGSNS